MQQLSKLQIRAKVLSVISKIKTLRFYNEEALNTCYEEFSEIEDKNALFDIFLKEYIKLDSEEICSFCACLIKMLVSIDYITDKAMTYLKNTSLSDAIKYKIVQLLRITGGNYNYADLPNYFNNPQEVMDLETKRLLDSAVFNPEAMLDFLDFVSAVSEHDKNLLLKSLNIDYKGDVLANIVYPVIYSDFDDKFKLQVVEVLSESKSSLAVSPLEYLINTSSNEQIVNACKKGLKILKLAGACKEKSDAYYKNILKSSTLSHAFVTIPDGSGKQALLITRKHDNGLFSLAAFVVSDLIGIVDCFGFFNISQDETIRIINKFYNSEGQFLVPFEYIKSVIDNYQNLTIQNKHSFPYEFICWNTIIYDIKKLDFNMSDYADKNCKTQIMTIDNVLELMTEEYTLRWFLTPGDNKVIKNIIDEIYNMENFDVPSVNKMILDNINNIFDDNVNNIWINRIYNLIYILRQNTKLKDADCFYTILKNEKFFDIFKQVITQRSIFTNFMALRENIKDSFLTKNIFKKRNANELKYDIKKIDEIIEKLQRDWLGL